MAAAWMTFVCGWMVVYTVAEGAPSSSSSSSSSSSGPSGGGAAYAGDGGGAAYSGNGGGSMAYAGDGGGGGFFFPNFPYQQPNPYMPYPFDFNAAFQQQLAALAMLQAGFPNPYSFPAGGQGAYVNTNSLGGDGAMAAASASGPDDGIALRIGPGDFPTSGGNGGSFSSFSSSSSSDDGNGQKRFQSTVGVKNNDGKIYFKTAHSP